MKSRVAGTLAMFVLLLCSLSPALAANKPLKVFILVGQSNMEGHAQTMTFPAIAKDPKTAGLYKDMVDAAGKPVICDNVWIAYTYGDFNGLPAGNKSGKLTAGFGSQHHVGTGKIGPEFTFGIYMQKMLNEPILLIKAAWGGRSLMGDFRPPSAGDIADEKAKKGPGAFYKLVIDYVKEVLADPKKVYPGYDPQAGYELAGFVWFQGFNDLVGNYPPVDPTKGKNSIKDYSEYSRLLACLIRDVRKDLSAPNLPFVIGVMGLGGSDDASENGAAFRKSMAAPGEMEEFKGTVANVFTEKYWPVELDPVSAKVKAAKEEFAKEVKLKTASNSDGGKKNDKQDKSKLEADKRAKIEKALTPDELFLLDNGISNFTYHYYGSAKFFAQAGKAFAESLFEMRTKQ